MKKTLSLLIILFIMISLSLQIFSFKSYAMQYEVKEEIMKETIAEDVEEFVYDTSAEKLITYMEKELSEIEYLKEKNKLEWYKVYRTIVCKYINVVGMPSTVFEFYTGEEVRLICRTVETECYGKDFDSKVNVASVIFNRIEHPDKIYGETVEKVITSPKQFAYWRKVIPEDTLFAVLYAFEIEDTTNGCLSFNSNKKTDKFDGRSYVFSDSAGHHFFR